LIWFRKLKSGKLFHGDALSMHLWLLRGWLSGWWDDYLARMIIWIIGWGWFLTSARFWALVRKSKSGKLFHGVALSTCEDERVRMIPHKYSTSTCKETRVVSSFMGLLWALVRMISVSSESVCEEILQTETMLLCIVNWSLQFYRRQLRKNCH